MKKLFLVFTTIIFAGLLISSFYTRKHRFYKSYTIYTPSHTKKNLHIINKQLSIIPVPQYYALDTSKTIDFKGKIRIVCKDDDLKISCLFLEKELKKILSFFPNHKKITGTQSFPLSNRIPLKIAPPYATDIFSVACISQTITIYIKKNPEERHEEGYTLSINPDKKRITITGRKKGIFYGMQSLLQILYTRFDERTQTTDLPECYIKDFPNMPYRGLHIDVARHFFQVRDLKKMINLMATYKLNKLHLHLSDDQGFRLESKTYPLLTRIGSKRKGTLIGKDLGKKEKYVIDNKPYGGFYTQEDIKSLLYYAKIHQVEIIPEIDIPFHSLAMIAAYPFLACDTTQKYEVQTIWRGASIPLCLGKERTYTFLRNLFKEISNLFYGTYIHIGQDEAKGKAWKKCPDCIRVMKQNHIHTLIEYQQYAVRRIQKYLHTLGKKTIIWNDIFNPKQIDKTTTVMIWKHPKQIHKILENGYPAILVYNDKFYLDYYQTDNPKQEPLSFNRTNTLREIYFYALPFPILGTEGAIWTEYVPDFKILQFKVFPRLLAIAERSWTQPRNLNYQNFLSRLESTTFRLDLLEVPYAPFFRQELYALKNNRKE